MADRQWEAKMPIRALWQQMEGRAITCVVVATGLLFGSYQPGAHTMPEIVLWWSRIVFGAVIVGGLFVLLVTVVRMIVHVARAHRYQRPMVNKNKPDRDQWLRDFAADDAASPQSLVRVIERRINGSEFDTRRPWVMFHVRLFNGTLHTLDITAATGFIRFDNVPLEKPLEGIGVPSAVRGAQSDILIKQYIPKDILDEVKQAVTSSRANRFDLDNVVVTIIPRTAGGQASVCGLGGPLIV